MNSALRHNAPTALLAPVCAVALLWGLAASALGASPLPSSDYTVQAVCGTPAPRQAACLALQLVPLTATARAHSHPLAAVAPASHPAGAASEGEFGLTPSDLHTAYQLPLTASGAQTIALVDAYNDPTAEADLKHYDEELALPECTTGNGCFEQVNQEGKPESLPFPASTAELEGATKSKRAEEAIGWGAEISLDIETAHAVCQSCKILLVEANSPELEDLEAAERAAETLKANEISNSWGVPELGVKATEEEHGPFDHPETVITAAAGDNGYLEWAAESPFRSASFPASSPHVVAVGGTRLLLSESANWQTESVWNDGGESHGVKEGFGADGGGCSVVFSAEPWQSEVSSWPEVGCGTMRAVSDVAADADPYTGVPVYYERCNSEYEKRIVHWCTYGGTSLASPIIAATYALAGGAQGVKYPAKTLYEKAAAHPYALHDVISGSNGACLKPFNEESKATGCTNPQEGASCSSTSICVAGIGYDGPSGVGTPHGLAAFEPASAAENPQEEAELKAEREAQETIKKAEEVHQGEQVKHQEEVEREQEAEQKQETKRTEAEREEVEREELKRFREETLRQYHNTPATPAVPPAPVPGTSAPKPASVTPSELSGLALTVKAVIALNASRPRIAQISFTFTLLTPAQVKVTLAKRVRVHGHTRWHNVRGPVAITGASGHNSRQLGGHGTLTAGLYRLTAAASHAAAQALLFHIG
jgi:hypothetical protein